MNVLDITITCPTEIAEALSANGSGERVCALALYANEIRRAIPLTNEHRNRSRNFYVSARQTSKLRGRYILAHSHTGQHHKQGPSRSDIDGLKPGEMGAVYLPHIKILVLYTRQTSRAVSLATTTATTAATTTAVIPSPRPRT